MSSPSSVITGGLLFTQSLVITGGLGAGAPVVLPIFIGGHYGESRKKRRKKLPEPVTWNWMPPEPKARQINPALASSLIHIENTVAAEKIEMIRLWAKEAEIRQRNARIAEAFHQQAIARAKWEELLQMEDEELLLEWGLFN